ncbi:MAG: H(+)/Cl(-) exchange transporter ClcA [Anaerolineae bacterium]
MDTTADEPRTEPDKHQNEPVNSEIREYLDIRRQRWWIFPRAALVGVLVGGFTLLFRLALSGADLVRNHLIDWARHLPSLGWIFPIFFTMAGAVLAVALTRKYAPEAAGSGIPHIEAVLHRFRNLNWKRLLPVKFVGGVLAIGGGLALGREGPTVQMGGAAGAAVADLVKASEGQRLTLISAGSGAGLAAAFNAPLSGLIFVLEEVRRDFQPIVFGAVFVAAAAADIVTRIGSGQLPVFAVPSYGMLPLGSLPLFAVLGIAAGLLGVLFNRILLFAIKSYARVPARFKLPAAAATGALVGLVGWFSPLLIGSGHTLALAAMNGEIALVLIPMFFIVRLALTSSSYGAGAPGGIFAPLLALGALLGLAVGQIGHAFMPSVVTIPAAFAVVGMAAYFTAIVRAPLTGIMLILEMTGNYNQMLPL